MAEPAAPPTGTGNAGGNAEPPTPPAAPASEWTDERVNALSGKKHKEGADRKLREILARAEVGTEDELIELVSRGRTVEPPKKTPQEREADKQRAAFAEREAELQKQLAVVAAERDAERIHRMLLPVLSDARDADAALLVVKHKTGFNFAIRDGKPVVLDKDGDATGEDPVKWLTERIKQDEFRYLLKPSVGGTNERQERPGKRPTTQSAPETVDLHRHGSLAGIILEEARGARG